MMSITRRKIFAAVLASLSASSVFGHEFWLAASSWQAAAGQSITVTANVGERFPNPSSYTAPERVASVELVGPGLRRALDVRFSREGDSLAAAVALPPQPATYIVSMTIKPRLIEIQPREFTRYLTNEGLERIVQQRQRLGEAGKPGRERYSRYAKLLIRAERRPGGGGAAANDAYVNRPIGLTAELVPGSDLTQHRIGDEVAVRLLFKGKPVAGALVGAVNAGSTGEADEWPVKGRTDANGYVRFRLHEPGPWLIRSVHMVRRGGEKGAGAADWESYWASLTFNFAE